MKSKQRMKLWLYLVLIAFTAVIFGYLRDSIFKTINALLRSWDLEQDYFLPPFLSFLENFEYDTLLNLKWLLTFIFSLLYLALSLIAVKLLFSGRHFLKITVLSYVVILFVSFVFMALGYFLSSSAEKMYEFARYLMGMAQSPLVLMILIPAFKLSEKEIKKTEDI